MPRILSVSGLRGVVGDGLDPDFLTRFGQAVGTLALREKGNPGLVVLTRDGRPTGPMVRHCVLGGLLAAGCRVLDGGVAMTPTCGVLVQHHGAAAGLQITASHNPLEWNGLKPFSPSGGVLNLTQGEALVRLLESGDFAAAGWEGVGSVEPLADPHGPHLRRVLDLIDRDAIRAQRFKVVLDCNRGSGAAATPGFLREELGCEVTVLGETPDGLFEHTPEPTEANLTGLCTAVREAGADVGFAQDPDADRLAIVDETGRYIGEELTLALCADHVLYTRKGPLVVNGSTSRVNADVAAKHGCAFHRSAVGEANVVGEMNRVGAALGGEGNGGVIEPNVGPVRDSLVSIAYVLDGLAKRGGSVGQWADSLPRYAIVKNKFIVPSPDRVNAACTALAEAYPDAEAKWGDGLRLDWADRWVQVRASNTEPIARVIAEAPTGAVSEALATEATAICERAAA
ncbi:phosphoglucosamine mutase [Alienimonas californiensis]|uniref:Phosphoglucosamine mutase n=1 Tax=Alienimonas californiensis TaxID=2527989 RepID=A0A517PD91_9PLAN|nr:phosphoglucosamine mutase [Alienimonas californiensis]QDT17343.1 Phosphoglucosamine mutase [Alienimonas californiensis]